VILRLHAATTVFQNDEIFVTNKPLQQARFLLPRPRE